MNVFDTCHLVRSGLLGSIGRFTAAENAGYPRGDRVIVRTARGLEIGQVLAPPHRLAGDGLLPAGDGSSLTRWPAGSPLPITGEILRAMTPADHLLETRLEKNRREAIAACAERIAAAGLAAVLIDVEHLFDGQTLVFHFLGETTAELDAVTKELADTYDATAQFRKFTETLVQGCGPSCGQPLGADDDGASGHGCGNCGSGCALAAACAPRDSHPHA